MLRNLKGSNQSEISNWDSQFTLLFAISFNCLFSFKICSNYPMRPHFYVCTMILNAPMISRAGDRWYYQLGSMFAVHTVACKKVESYETSEMRSLFYNGHRLGSLGSGRTGECVNNRAGRFVHRCGLVRPAVETKQINTSLSLPIILPIFGWLRS